MLLSETNTLHFFYNSQSSHRICFTGIVYRGSRMLDIRLWKRNKISGAYMPTSMGVRIHANHIHDVSLALQKFELHEKTS